MEKFLNMKQVATLLEVHPATIARFCKKGELTYYMVGARKRFLIEDIEAYKQGRKHNATDDETKGDNPFTTN